MSLIGTLSEIKIADVLRLFAAGKKSGLLTVAHGPNQALVRFQRGALVHASAGRLHGEEAVVDLFGWKEGQLTFVPEERAVTPNVARDVDTLILEGLKVGERMHRMRELIPSDQAVFQHAAGPADGVRHAIGRPEWSVVRLLDGVRDVGEVVEDSGLPRSEVLGILFELTEAGFLEKVEVRQAMRVQSKGRLGGEAAEVDDRFDDDWRRVSRFASGVLRIEIRTPAGRTAPVGVAFRRGLVREIHLPRGVLADLGLKDGDEVWVRPIA